MRSSAVPVYILAGGRATRFGGDKARAMLDGKPLIIRVAEGLAPVASRITVVARVADEYRDLGLRTIADRVPGLGPIGGLDTALHEEGGSQLLLASCDLVEARPAWVEALQAAAPDAAAVAFRERQRWEPLFALYRRSIAPLVSERIAAGRLDMNGLLEAAGAVAVPLPADRPEPFQVNTLDDLERARG